MVLVLELCLCQRAALHMQRHPQGTVQDARQWLEHAQHKHSKQRNHRPFTAEARAPAPEEVTP